MPSAAEAAPVGHDVVYAGPTRALFGLYLRTWLLSILTLGLYRFWAKTRIRRFLWGHTHVDGEPFEYIGTGKELFIGFLKAAAILIPLFVGFQVLGILIVGDKADKVVAPFQAMLVLILIYVGTYAARRYRMSRTLWRGIRFQQHGSPWRYAALATRGVFLNIVTLGLYYPVMQVQLLRYETENLRFGSHAFRFSGRASTLFKAYLAFWATLVGSVAAFVLAMAALQDSFDLASNPGLAAGVSVIPLVMLAAIIGLFFWYQGRFHRFRAESTALGGLRFAMPAMSGAKLSRLMLGNSLLTGISLGLLSPLVLQRTMRFWTRHLHIAGALDFAAVVQAVGGPKTGEGLAGFFNVDMG